MMTWKWWVAASVTALSLTAADAAQAQSDWRYVPMNSKSWTTTPTNGDVLAPAQQAAAQIVCRTGEASGVAVRSAPAASKRLVIVMQGGGGCINEELCEANPDSFSYQEFMSLRLGELNSGIFFRNGTDNPFRDYHQAYIPYCSGDMHAGNIVRDVEHVGPQTFNGYANTALYFDELFARFRSVITQPGAEVMLLGQSAGGYGAAFNLPRVREKLRAVAPNARLIFVSESAPLMDQTVGEPCLTATWRDFFQYQATFLGTCPTCTSSNWMAEWHEHIMRTSPGVSHALFAAERDIVVKQVMEADWPATTHSSACAGAASFDYTRFEAGLRSARSRMQAAIWRGTPTATYFVTNPAWSWYHMFLTYPWYYAQQEPNWWGRQVKLNEWLPGLFDSAPDFGDHVGFP